MDFISNLVKGHPKESSDTQIPDSQQDKPSTYNDSDDTGKISDQPEESIGQYSTSKYSNTDADQDTTAAAADDVPTSGYAYGDDKTTTDDAPSGGYGKTTADDETYGGDYKTTTEDATPGDDYKSIAGDTPSGGYGDYKSTTDDAPTGGYGGDYKSTTTTDDATAGGYDGEYKSTTADDETSGGYGDYKTDPTTKTTDDSEYPSGDTEGYSSKKSQVGEDYSDEPSDYTGAGGYSSKPSGYDAIADETESQLESGYSGSKKTGGGYSSNDY